jgi:hypothetical protein
VDGKETWLTRFFAAAMARRSKKAIRRASTSTKPSSSASGSARLTYPYRSAVSPSKSFAPTPIDYRQLYRFPICAACQRPSDRKTAPRIAWCRQELRGSMDQPGYDFPQRRLSESLPDMTHPPLAVALHDPVKE